MTETILTISSKNYSSWSLRGWLLCKMAGREFSEEVVPVDDPANRAELLLLSPSILVPCLTHDGTKIWDTLAIAEYLNEVVRKISGGVLYPIWATKDLSDTGTVYAVDGKSRQVAPEMARLPGVSAVGRAMYPEREDVNGSGKIAPAQRPKSVAS